MLDFSRAEGSKNHRASLMKASNTIIEIIEQLQKDYNAIWEKLEVQRKERAAIIEETIQLLKNSKVKLNKQLGRCDNVELNKELLRVIPDLPDDQKEIIQINLVRINNRYERICKLGKKLEAFTQTLARYRIMEKDYDQEVELVVPSKKKELAVEEVKEEPKVEVKEEKLDSDTERVISRSKASKELSDSLDKTLESMARPDNSMKSTLIEEDDIRYKNEENLFDTNELSSIEDEIERITEEDETEDKINEFLESQSNIEESSDEYVLFTINELTTLKEIAKNVYQSEDHWKYIYNYGNNKGKMDRKAAEYEVDIEEIASTPGCLRNVTLQFPTTLVAQEELTYDEDNIVEFPSRGRRAA